MSDALPPPLVPADVDLQDFRFMPLDVVRLRDSSLIAQATGEEFRCAVLLWCAAWHQVPAGSLPDDDAVLAGYAGFGRSIKRWQKRRPIVMRGWVKCADGRLYHPVVSEKALGAYDAKLRKFFKNECDRIKKFSFRAGIDPVYPSYAEWLQHFTETGERHWNPQRETAEHNLSRGTAEGQPRDVPSTSPGIRTPNREGEGEGEKSFKALPTTSASMEVSERGRALARAFAKGGYEVEEDSDLVRRLEAQGVTPAEVEEAVEAAKRWLRRKPLAWVLSRIEGRRADALAGSAGAEGGNARPEDLAQRARAEADRKLQDTLIDLRAMQETLQLITPAERAEREAVARAAHRAAIAALEAAA
jgi:hypothetical protein